MKTKDQILGELKGLAKEKRTVGRSLRVPFSMDKEIAKLAETTGANYTDVILKLLEAGLEVLRGKP